MEIITESDRRAEVERIHTEAVALIIGESCKLFAAVVHDLQAELRRHGFSGANGIVVSSKVEYEASGLLESMKAAIADDLPIDPENAVAAMDDFSILEEDSEFQEVAARVRTTCRELLGVCD